MRGSAAYFPAHSSLPPLLPYAEAAWRALGRAAPWAVVTLLCPAQAGLETAPPGVLDFWPPRLVNKTRSRREDSLEAMRLSRYSQQLQIQQSLMRG